MDHISLIGAPTDVGASVLGCRMGPAALRLAGLQASLERFGSEVRDCGDVPLQGDLLARPAPC